MRKTKVGFIGLGLMGNPMAKNIFKKGFDLAVYNRSESRLKEFKKLGVKIASTLAELAKLSDIIVTMVTGPKDVSEVCFGENGIVKGAHKGLIVIDMSTIGPSAAIKISKGLQKEGIEFLDAPVTGSVLRAISGELTIFIGGNLQTYQKAKSVLSAMGKNLRYIGDIGKGQAVKLINNLIVGETISALAEGMLLADYMGLSRKAVLDNLSDVSTMAPNMKLKIPNMVDNKFLAAFSLANMRKDLNLALKEAEKKGKLPVLKLVDKFYKKGIALGFGQEDLSAIIKVLAK